MTRQPRVVDADAFSGHVVLTLRQDGLPLLRVMQRDWSASYDIPRPTRRPLSRWSSVISHPARSRSRRKPHGVGFVVGRGPRIR